MNGAAAAPNPGLQDDPSVAWHRVDWQVARLRHHSRPDSTGANGIADSFRSEE